MASPPRSCIQDMLAAPLRELYEFSRSCNASGCTLTIDQNKEEPAVPDTTVTNWFGDIASHPQVVVDAASVEDLVRIVKDTAHYPSPVRAVGSNHSTAACGVAEGGTLVRMSKMNR